MSINAYPYEIKVWFDNDRYFYYENKIKENLCTWFEELVTEPSMPEKIVVTNAYWDKDKYGEKIIVRLGSILSNEKIKTLNLGFMRSIENVLNDTVVGGGVDVEFKMERFYTQSEVDAMMEEAFLNARRGYRSSQDKDGYMVGNFIYPTFADYKATLPLQQQSKKQSPYNDRNGKPS